MSYSCRLVALITVALTVSTSPIQAETFRGALVAGVEDDGKYFTTYNHYFQTGTTYTIDLMSTEFDPYLYIFDSSYTKMAEDDDGGSGYNSRITFRPGKSGSYILWVTSFAPKTKGAFTLSVTGAGSSPAAKSATKAAPVKVVNNTTREVNVKVVDYWLDGNGEKKWAKNSYWTILPNDWSFLLYKNEPFYASEFRYILTTPEGRTPESGKVWTNRFVSGESLIVPINTTDLPVQVASRPISPAIPASPRSPVSGNDVEELMRKLGPPPTLPKFDSIPEARDRQTIASTGFLAFADHRFFKASDIVAESATKRIHYTVDGKPASRPYSTVTMIGTPTGYWHYNPGTRLFVFTPVVGNSNLDYRFEALLAQSIRRKQRPRDHLGLEYPASRADEFERQEVVRRQREAEELARQRKAEEVARQQREAEELARRQRQVEEDNRRVAAALTTIFNGVKAVRQANLEANRAEATRTQASQIAYVNRWEEVDVRDNFAPTGFRKDIRVLLTFTKSGQVTIRAGYKEDGQWLVGSLSGARYWLDDTARGDAGQSFWVTIRQPGAPLSFRAQFDCAVID